jgi:hypothetical protein
MRSYSAKGDVFTERDMMILVAAEHVVAILPDTMGRRGPTRCHEVARVCAKLMDLEVIDGRYGLVQHSWCLTKDRAILDPYAVGRLPQVQLVSEYGVVGFARNYQPSASLRTDIHTWWVSHMVKKIEASIPRWRREKFPVYRTTKPAKAAAE